MFSLPRPATSPLTEDQIERVVEKRTDTLDEEFLSGKMKQAAYDANCKALDEWATREYARTRAHRAAHIESEGV